MKRFLSSIALALLSWPGGVGWAQNTVPNFSHGPTTAAFGIRFETPGDALDARFSMLTEGLGYSLNINNVVASSDGGMSWLGVAFPLYPRIFDSEFSLGFGGGVSLFNALVQIGAAVDMVNTATDRGALIGKVGAEEVLVYVGLGFNLGSGEPRELPATVSKAAADEIAAQARSPFNYVSLRR